MLWGNWCSQVHGESYGWREEAGLLVEDPLGFLMEANNGMAWGNGSVNDQA